MDSPTRRSSIPVPKSRFFFPIVSKATITLNGNEPSITPATTNTNNNYNNNNYNNHNNINNNSSSNYNNINNNSNSNNNNDNSIYMTKSLATPIIIDTQHLQEDNKRLRLVQDELMSKALQTQQKNIQLERDNERILKELNDLKGKQITLKAQFDQILEKLGDEHTERQVYQNVTLEQKKVIDNLMEQVQAQRVDYRKLLDTNNRIKNRLEEVLPTNLNNNNSGFDLDKNIQLTSEQRDKNTNNDNDDLITNDVMEKMINEIGNLKTYINNLQLELYEANEKISEYVEHKNQLEEDNDTLRKENTELNNITNLMSSEMKQSIGVGKKMEETIIKMKYHNDELTKRNRDSIDSPNILQVTNNEQIKLLKNELDKQTMQHEQQLADMTKLMEEAIDKNTNDRMRELEIKLEIVEKELQIAVDRAERAENELIEVKNVGKRNSNFNLFGVMAIAPPATPPPQTVTAIDSCIYCLCKKKDNLIKEELEVASSIAPPPPPPPPPLAPPPPPPPMPNLFNSNKHYNSGENIINSNKPADPRKNQQQVKATGIDALIAELKDGRVTLRRRQRPNNINNNKKDNKVLDEMFELLEKSRKQNRSSKILIENHIKNVITITDNDIGKF